MTEIKHFLKEPKLRTFFIQGKNIELLLKEDVFPPSINGCFVAENILINENERVADVGAGSGLIAILAAMLGGISFGTDINDASINLSKENALRNNINSTFKKSKYLDCFNHSFDVIVANLPQDIVPKNYEKAIGKELFKTISGGENGNFHILNFLEKAPRNMHKDTRLYLPVYTDVCYKPIMKKIKKDFEYKIIAKKIYETREFVNAKNNSFKKLFKTKQVNIFLKNEKWCAIEYLFELKLKKELN